MGLAQDQARREVSLRLEIDSPLFVRQSTPASSVLLYHLAQDHIDSIKPLSPPLHSVDYLLEHFK
jgi:hypothetical protein